MAGPIIRPPAWRRWAVLGVLGFGAMLGIAQGVGSLLPEHDGPTCGWPGFENALWGHRGRGRMGTFRIEEPVRCAGGYGYAHVIATVNYEHDGDVLFRYRKGSWELLQRDADISSPESTGIPPDVFARMFAPRSP